MNLDEFQKQQLPPDQADRWFWIRNVETPFASFQVELLMMDEGDTAPPDERMTPLAEELAKFAEEHSDEIWDFAYGYYLMASENPSWMQYCGVPQGLSRSAIKDAIFEPGLVIGRHKTESPSPYVCAIRVGMKWKMEHTVWLNFQDGKIVGEAGQACYLENGVLRYVPEEPPPPPPVVAPSVEPPASKRRTMDASWLRKKMTVAEAEAEHMVSLADEDGTRREVPFGYCNRDWMELVTAMQEGDELWSYSSSDESWANLAGRMGLVLLRDGEVIESVLTAMN